MGNETGEAKASNTADTAIDSGSMDAPGPATSQKRGEADSLPGSPKMQRVEMTSQQHRGTTPWILQASEPQRLRGLNILQINNECFRWQALTWAFTSTKTLHWSLTSAMMMLMRWKSMIWSFMMINFFRRTIRVWLTMQTCPRSWINLLFLTQSKNQNWVLMSSSRFVRT